MPYWRFLCGALAFACNDSPLGPMVDVFAQASAMTIDALVAADAAPAILTPEAAT